MKKLIIILLVFSGLYGQLFAQGATSTASTSSASTTNLIATTTQEMSAEKKRLQHC